MSESDVTALQAQIAQLQEQIKNMQQAKAEVPATPAQSIPAVVPFPSSGRSLKVAPPDYFDGSLTKTQSFLAQLLLFLHGKRAEVQSDQDKIVLALSYMKGGTAGPWAEIKVQELGDGIEQSWDVFLAEFKLLFSDPNPGATARAKMDQLAQGNLTADEYVVKFKELQANTGYNDIALVEKFEKGLNSVLVDKIYALPTMPTTLEGWISWSTKLDRQWRKREAMKKANQPSSSSSKAKPYSVPSNLSTPQSNSTPQPQKPFIPRPTDMVPMEVDSGKKSKTVICFKCRKPGHIARDCQSTFNINNLTYDDLKVYFQNEEEKKDFQPSH